MKKFLVLIFVLISFWGQAQKPFMQSVKYQINVTLDDRLHVLRGDYTLDYTNHSKDTLKYIMLHLYPNAYSTESSLYSRREAFNKKTEFYFSRNEDKGFIDSLFFIADGKETFFSYFQNNKDVILVHLNKPLAPEESVRIKTPMRIKIPKVFSRMGHEKQSYYITQWYPKPAVFDMQGWHPIPYIDMGEYYGEFGDYDIRITLPENYVLATSGEIQTESEKLFLDSLAAKRFSGVKKKVSLSKFQNDAEDSIPPSSKTLKTVHITQSNVHDFAWAADKLFVVRTLDTAFNGSSVKIFSYIQPKDYYKWKKSNLYAAQAIGYCTEKVGPYPYRQMHVVDGNLSAGAGMEYPTFTIISTIDSTTLPKVIYHEVAHNWFYGLLGNNERDEPFMDESFTSFLDEKIFEHFNDNQKSGFVKIEGFDQEKLNNKVNELEKKSYAFYVGANKYATVDQPAMAYTEMAYGVMIYAYGKELLNYLKDYLGENEFWTLIHGYYNENHHQHTSIASFKAYCLTHSKKDVSWFFDEAMTNPRPIDFKLSKVHSNSSLTSVRLVNKTHMKVPVSVSYTSNNETKTQWINPFRTDTTIQLSSGAKNIVINKNQSIPETNFKNNSTKNAPQIKLGPLLFDGLNKRQISVLPTLGYNIYDGIMVGLAANNITPFPQPWTYWINPMIGLRSKSLVGNAHVQRNWVMYNSSWLKEALARLEVKSYDFNESFNTLNKKDLLLKRYIKVAPKFSLVLDDNRMDNQIQSEISGGVYYIREQNWKSEMNLSDSSFYLSKNNWDDQVYGTLSFNHYNHRLYNPYEYRLDLHAHKDFVKLIATAKLKVNYNYSKKGISFRLFAGYIIPTQKYIDRRYYLQTTNTAETDYLYDETMIGRSEQSGIASQQIFMREGGFKSSTPYYANPISMADQWMVALNTTLDLPTKIPLKLYLDLATHNGIKSYLPSGNRMIMNSGVMLDLKFLKIYVPVFNSVDYKDYNKYFNNKFLGKISFELNLSTFNQPQKFVQGLMN